MILRCLSILLLALGALAPSAPGFAAPVTLSGAGATFPAPIYAGWAEVYRLRTGNRINYQPIGSGGGIKQIKARTIDFGASDKPMKPADLAAAGLYQFPTVVGGVVPIVHVPGIPTNRLKLSGAVLGDIFLGRIKRWNAKPIAALNPGLPLPNLPITVVHRSDGSGTTFLFTSFLAARSPEWAKVVGASDAVQWPAGIGGKGNDGVSAFVKQTFGAIGYVEYAFAKQTGAPVALVQNRDGAFPPPVAASFAAAAASAPWAGAPGNYVLLVDQPGRAAWPITGATFVLIPRNPADPARAKGVLRFFDWAYHIGDRAALSLDYVPLPPRVRIMIRRQWNTAVTAGGQPVYPTR
ncbi:phosphate ABC transporter substrate-binding protein PstS [Sphingomonas naphthae]|uniref:Phosphate-binding protein PstS n=1 Tax=Sphingomonas naphthae TaxID=1813468 RepID=A0ABY7TL63_9SPHN|nr:phosphate ABC transporter substrate-binding protein PstS [Sphingomonas naphthae]WCT73982.1 phosphate ABC transporter substrate-binding protein PstS [Sphingomonas naphthae]